MLRYDAVVIGGGVTGCAIGALLAGRGFKTALIERDSQLGGRARSYRFRGFKIDVGGHAVPAPDRNSISAVLDKSGAGIELVPAYPRMLYDRIEKKFERHAEYISETCNEQERKEVRRVIAVISRMSRSEIAKFEDLTAREWLEQATNRPELLEPFFILTSADMSSSSAAVILTTYNNALNSKVEIAYPKQGIEEIPLKLGDVISRCGGDLFLSTTAKEIVVQDGYVSAVRCHIAPSGSSYSHQLEIESRIVVSTVPFESTLNILSHDLATTTLVGQVEKWRRAPRQATIGLVAGTKKKLLEPAWFEIGVIPFDKTRKAWRLMFVPTAATTAVAPPGYHYFFYETASFEKDFVKEKDTVREELKNDLEVMYPGIEYEWMYDTYASCRSYSYDVTFTGKNAPDVKHQTINSIYFCGDQFKGIGDAGLTGLDRSLSSVRLCYRTILLDLGLSIDL